jgi:hypothetical protein
MTTATVKTKLTHKVGPFPVWAWAGLVIGTYFLIFRGPFGKAAKASGGTQLPYTPTSGSGAQQPASGQGSPVDNTNGDLLSALQENASSHDALLAALQYGAYGGFGDYSSGIGSGGSGGSTGGVPAPTQDTSTTTATTVDSGVNNAPVDAYTSAVQSAQSDSPDYSLIAAEIPLSGADQGYAVENAVLANPNIDYTQLSAALGIPVITDLTQAVQDATGIDYGSISVPTQITQPTPTIVQPAPVDSQPVYDVSSGTPQQVGTTSTIRTAPLGKTYVT